MCDFQDCRKHTRVKGAKEEKMDWILFSSNDISQEEAADGSRTPLAISLLCINKRNPWKHQGLHSFTYTWMYLPNPLTTLSGDSDLREEIRMYSSSFVRKKSGRQIHTQTFSFDTGAHEDREAVQGSHGRKRQQSQFPLSKSCCLCFAPFKPAMYAEKSSRR